MRFLAIILLILSAMPASAAELSWFLGAPDVPLGQHSYAERLKQSELGKLSWAAVPLEVPLELVQDVDRAEKPAALSIASAMRWPAPQRLPIDIVAYGIDPDLPFPNPDALSIINWANGQGGAAIISGGKLSDLADLQIAGPVSVEAFSRGRWNPDFAPDGGWDKLLTLGRKVFIVGSASPGIVVLGNDSAATYVLAKNTDTSSISAALRSGRCVVSENGVILLGFRVNGSYTGSSVVPERGQVEVSLDIDSSEEVTEVIIYGNVVRLENSRLIGRTEALKTVPINAKKISVKFDLPVHKTTAYLRAVAVSRIANARTLTNPIFITAEQAEDDASGHERKLRTIEVMLRKIDWSWTDASQILSTLLSNSEVAPAAAQMMAKTFGAKELAAVKTLLDSPLSSVRAHAAYIILKAGGSDGFNTILEMLGSADLDTRLYAAQILALHAGPEHLEHALRLAKDQSMDAKRYAYIALSKIPHADSLRALRQAGLMAAGTDNASLVFSCVSECLQLRPKRKDIFYQDFLAGKLDEGFAAYMIGREEMIEHALNISGADEMRGGEPNEQEKKEDTKFREVMAKWTNVRPKIDGELDRNIWDKINSMGEFKTARGTGANQETSFGILYDEYAMYIYLECTESEMQKIIAREKAQDGDVFNDDSISIYISPTNDRTIPAKYFRFSANTLGTRMEEEGDRRRWNAEWSAASTRGPERWTLEIAIPFRAIGVNPLRGANEWLINIVRHRKAGEPEESLLQPGDPKDSTGNAILKFQKP